MVDFIAGKAAEFILFRYAVQFGRGILENSKNGLEGQDHRETERPFLSIVGMDCGWSHEIER